MHSLHKLAVIALTMFLAGSGSLGSAAAAGQCRGGVFSLYGGNLVPLEAPELANPDVAGISVRLHWKVMEPRPGAYDWQRLDQAIALARKYRKKLMIRVIAGIYSPDWVFHQGAQQVQIPKRAEQKLMRRFATTSDQVGQIKIPVPWDKLYLEKWLAFIQAMGGRYNGNPTIYSIQMTGAGLAGEMVLREEFEWQRYGYADARLIATWQQIIDTYQRSFPQTPTNLAIYEPLPRESKVMWPVVNYCLEKYPGKVYLQWNGLRAQGTEPSAREVLRLAGAKTLTGYQMLGGRGWLDQETGDRRLAFDTALADRVSYLEVYRSDLQEPSSRDAIHKLAVGLDCSR